MSTHQPSSSASSSPSSTGGFDRKPDNRSATGPSGTTARAAFPARLRAAPFCPSSRNGVTLLLVTPLAQVAAATDTEPEASPNCASMAEWLDGMRPYCHFVAVRGLISYGSFDASPNCSTRLA